MSTNWESGVGLHARAAGAARLLKQGKRAHAGLTAARQALLAAGLELHEAAGAGQLSAAPRAHPAPRRPRRRAAGNACSSRGRRSPCIRRTCGQRACGGRCVKRGQPLRAARANRALRVLHAALSRDTHSQRLRPAALMHPGQGCDTVGAITSGRGLLSGPGLAEGLLGVRAGDQSPVLANQTIVGGSWETYYLIPGGCGPYIERCCPGSCCPAVPPLPEDKASTTEMAEAVCSLRGRRGTRRVPAGGGAPRSSDLRDLSAPRRAAARTAAGAVMQRRQVHRHADMRAAPARRGTAARGCPPQRRAQGCSAPRLALATGRPPSGQSRAGAAAAMTTLFPLAPRP